MTAQATLPPITIEHVIGLAGDRNEPVTAEHLNTGISAADAAALSAEAPKYPQGIRGQHLTAAIFAFAAAGISYVGGVVHNRFGDDPQQSILGLVMVGVGFVTLAAAVAFGLNASLQTRQYAKQKAAFQAAILSALRVQDKLITLPFISGYDHYAVVTAIQKDLELARVRLMDFAEDNRIPVAGEKELLVALGALGDYARTEHPTDQQYTTARDAARAFITLQEQTTGELTSVASKRKAAL
jgi:hypothetical protein